MVAATFGNVVASRLGPEIHVDVRVLQLRLSFTEVRHESVIENPRHRALEDRTHSSQHKRVYRGRR